MPSHTKDMTQGNPTKLILQFSLPLLAGNILQQLYNLVDTLVVGRAEGVTALAAVSSTGWLDWTLLGLILGLAQGFAIQIAHSFGAGDHAGLRRAAGHSIVLAITVVTALEIIAQFALRPVLTLMNTPADTYELTLLYLRIVFGGLPLVMGTTCSPASCARLETAVPRCSPSPVQPSATSFWMCFLWYISTGVWLASPLLR